MRSAQAFYGQQWFEPGWRHKFQAFKNTLQKKTPTFMLQAEVPWEVHGFFLHKAVADGGGEVLPISLAEVFSQIVALRAGCNPLTVNSPY